MNNQFALDDFRNPDHEPTELETLEEVMDLFRTDLTPLLGEGTLCDEVMRVIHPVVISLLQGMSHGTAHEIADVFGHKASILEQVSVSSAPDQRGVEIATAYLWREAERIARTHIETADPDDV